MPQSPKLEKTADEHRMPAPPVHPARAVVVEEAKEKEKAKFNKQENRKSIRYIAQDWKRKTLSRQKQDVNPKEVAAKAGAAGVSS